MCNGKERHYGCSLTIDALEELIGTMKRLQPTYGDPDKKYQCLVSEEMPNEVLETLRNLVNVNVMEKHPAYLPDAHTIYFWEEKDYLSELQLPYTSHLGGD